MAKVDLKSTFGLPVTFEDGELCFRGCECKEKVVVSIDDIRDQLLNQELDCPDVFYTKYKYIDSNSLLADRNIKAHIYVMAPNLAGIEFVKTRVTRCKSYPRIFETLSGIATILMQQYKSPKDNKTIKLHVKKGEKCIVPAGYDCVVVNGKQAPTLIVAEYSYCKAISRVVLDDNSGMAYYVIRKNAKQEIVRNPNYKIVNDAERVDMEKILTDAGISLKTPIIKQLVRKYEKFDWLLKEDSVSF